MINICAVSIGAFMEEADVAGNVVKHYDSVQPIPGKNLKLTIDYELQKELEALQISILPFLRSPVLLPEREQRR